MDEKRNRFAKIVNDKDRFNQNLLNRSSLESNTLKERGYLKTTIIFPKPSIPIQKSHLKS